MVDEAGKGIKNQVKDEIPALCLQHSDLWRSFPEVVQLWMRH